MGTLSDVGTIGDLTTGHLGRILQVTAAGEVHTERLTCELVAVTHTHVEDQAVSRLRLRMRGANFKVELPSDTAAQLLP